MNYSSNCFHWSCGIKEGNLLARSIMVDGGKSLIIVGLRNLKLLTTGSLKGNFSSIVKVTAFQNFLTERKNPDKDDDWISSAWFTM